MRELIQADVRDDVSPFVSEYQLNEDDRLV